MKKPEDTAQVKVLRDGEEHEFTVTLRPVSRLSSPLLCSSKANQQQKVTFESSIVFACFVDTLGVLSYPEKYHTMFSLDASFKPY